MQRPIRIGLLGSRFISSLHAEALRQVPGAEVVAVASPTREHVDDFARRFCVPHAHTEYRKLLEMDEVDMVVIGIPNDLHCQATLDAAAAGKHVVCEKPLCVSLDDADRMIEACRKARVKLMYAEELCFAPKYVRLKKLLDDGALGRPLLLKQSEKHDGPHADHFWDVGRSGGGVTLDMGCHAIEFFRWLLGKEKVRSVYAHMSLSVHGEKTRGDEDSLLILEFESGCVALAEESWTKKGGMDDRAEILGTHGSAYANLLQGNSILTYSEKGYDYAVEKAGSTRGWSFTMFEECWNYGFPQELAHFVDCVAHDKEPLETGEDGRAVLEVIYAAYESAGTGRRVELPFRPTAQRPIDLWQRRS